MKKLLYLSAHITMECNELEFLSSLGFECVTIGNYTKKVLVKNDPNQLSWTLHDWRYPVFNCNEELTQEFLKLNPNFVGYQYPPYQLTKEFISKFDVIIVSHSLVHLNSILNLTNNNQLIIWCSVGQSNPQMERNLSKMRGRIKVVRISPTEESIPNYSGTDYYILTCVDPVFSVDWLGTNLQAIAVARAIQTRASNTNFPILLEIAKNLPFKVYGKGNENLGNVNFNGGELSLSELVKTYQQNRVFLCGGSAPAPITYTFMEAMTVGIPTVALGKSLARSLYGNGNLYDIDNYIVNGETGYVSNNIDELKNYCSLLLKDYDLAKKISERAREYARNSWSFEKVKSRWEQVFKDSKILQ